MKKTLITIIAVAVLVGLTTQTWAAAAPQPIPPVPLMSIPYGFDSLDDLFGNCTPGDRVSLESVGPQAGVSSMRWDLYYQADRTNTCNRRLNLQKFRGAERMQFFVRSTTPGPLLVKLQERRGELFSAVIQVGADWTLVSLDLPNFKVNPANQQDGQLDPTQIVRVIVEDPLSLFGATGMRTLWFSEWTVDTVQLPFTTRPYALGFLEVPPGLDQASINTLYQFLGARADLTGIHMENGVPWPEALDNRDFSPQLMADWTTAKALIPPGHKVYVAINPLDPTRSHLASYWGTSQNMPLPAPWNMLPLNDPNVKIAYLNYARRVIEYFKPDYFVIGVEVNLALGRSQALWEQYKDLHRYVYTALKRDYPQLPIFASIQYTLLRTWADDPARQDNVAEMRDLLSMCDLLGLSVYPYGSGILGTNPKPVPEDYFDVALSFGKPIAITEGGYLSRGSTLAGHQYDYSASDQAQYLELLLRKATVYNFVFIVDWSAIDTDKLFASVFPPLVRDVATAAWGYIGLEDSNGFLKPAVSFWDAYLQLPKQ